jgi:hypothetical protein
MGRQKPDRVREGSNPHANGPLAVASSYGPLPRPSTPRSLLVPQPPAPHLRSHFPHDLENTAL